MHQHRLAAPESHESLPGLLGADSANNDVLNLSKWRILGVVCTILEPLWDLRKRPEQCLECRLRYSLRRSRASNAVRRPSYHWLTRASPAPASLSGHAWSPKRVRFRCLRSQRTVVLRSLLEVSLPSLKVPVTFPEMVFRARLFELPAGHGWHLLLADERQCCG